jgi:hypothetical protein
VLTETKFKELYEQAARLRAVGADGAARELLLFLFDYGGSAGGYGVVRLTFVLRDLAEIAGHTDPSRAAEAKKTREALVERRDVREKAARDGAADFSTTQELVALNRTLGDAARSMALYKDLKAAAESHPEIAEIRAMLSGLLHEEILSGDAEKIADQILFERLKRKILELGDQVAELAAGLPREKQIAHSVKETKALADGYRSAEVPRNDEMKRRLAELSREADDLLQRYARLRTLPQSERSRTRTESLARDLKGLVDRYAISPHLLQDEELRDGIEKLQKKLLELGDQIEELIAGQPLEKQISQSALETKTLVDRYRNVKELPRNDEVKRRLVELSGDADNLLQRHALLRGLPQGEGARKRIESLAQDLTGLVARYEINPHLLQDEELRDGIVKLARKVASQISEYRIEQDFGTDGGGLMAQYQPDLAEKITRDGVLAYEVLLRIDDDATAEKVAAWLLAFQRTPEMYTNLLTATRRARKTDIESRLHEEAERLMIA